MFGDLEDIWTNINILTYYCDLDLECSNPMFFTVHTGLWWCIITLSLVAKESTVQKIQWKESYFDRMNSCREFDLEDSSWCCITIPNLVTKCSAIQKISSGQTFTDILNLSCDLGLNAEVPFLHRSLQRLMLYYYQTKFGCKWTSSLEDTTEIVIFWLYKPLLWPWHWTQWTNFSVWHSGLWCCKTIPSLVTKCSWFRIYSWDKHSLTIWTFTVTSSLNAVIQFNPLKKFFFILFKNLVLINQWNGSRYQHVLALCAFLTGVIPRGLILRKFCVRCLCMFYVNLCQLILCFFWIICGLMACVQSKEETDWTLLSVVM